jgi:hypothetical protein
MKTNEIFATCPACIAEVMKHIVCFTPYIFAGRHMNFVLIGQTKGE